MNHVRFNRILIVNDSTANLQLLMGLLTEQGYTVNPFSSGELVLEFVQSTLPDLIMLHIKMPGMDGYEVCRRLKADERTSSIPVIFLGALEDERDKVKGFQAGGVDYITMPFQPEEMLARVRIHLRMRELTEGFEQEVDARTEELLVANKRLEEEIAERSRAEEVLLASEERFRAVMDSLEVLMYVADMDTYELLFVNKFCQNIFGDVVGKICWKTFQADQTGPCAFCTNKQLLDQQGKPTGVVVWEFQNTLTKLWYECRDSAIQWPDGRLVRIELASDITERKRVEEALHESEAFLKSLLDAIPIPVFYKDNAGRYLGFNRAYETFFGATRDSLIGKSVFDISPRELAEIYYAKDKELFDGGEAQQYESQVKNLHGVVRDVIFNKAVFTDSQGAIMGLIGTILDITERKLAEEEVRQLNQELEQRVADRTAQLEAANQELEAFSYSVSHDLRTPLRAIDGFSHILLDAYAGKLDDEGKRLLNVVRENTSRMGQLIDDMLKFSRTGRLELVSSEIDMEKMAHEVFTELQESVADSNAQLEIEHLPSAWGDRTMMRQVFINLLSNALKFSRAKEIPVIRVGATAGDAETIYYVKDNGAGFDMQYANKLFGVFQRLHSMNEFEGTGIGLAIVKRIISRHGGRVWAEGKPDEGATIYFALPRSGMAGSEAHR